MTAPRAAAALAALIAACGGGGGGGGGGAGEVVAVTVALPGAAPAETEQQLLAPLEHAVGALAGVIGVRGLAVDSAATVVVTFRRGVARDRATTAVRDAVAGIQGHLPAAATAPQLEAAAPPGAWVYATISDEPGAAAALRDQVQRLAGVRRVETCGVREGRVVLELVPEAMAATGVTAAEVAAAVRAADLALPGGRVAGGATDVAIRVTGGMTSIAELGDLAVATRPDGAAVRVRDLAAITERAETACVVVGAPRGALVRVGVAAASDSRAVAGALTAAGAVVLRGPVHRRDLAAAGAVHERARQVQARVTQGGAGWYAVVPRVGQRVQLVVDGADPWRGAPAIMAVLHGDDLAELRRRASAAVTALGGDAGVASVECQGCAEAPELRLEIDRARAADLGIEVAAIAEALRVAYGETVAELRDGARALDVVLTTDGGVARWQDLQVVARAAGRVALGDVVRAVEALAPAEVLHVDGRRAVVIWAQAAPRTTAAALRQRVAAALPDARLAPVDPASLAADRW